MKVYSYYNPFNSKAQVVYDSLNRIYSAMGIDFQIKMEDTQYGNTVRITVIYDTADVISYLESNANAHVGRKPTPLPSREELEQEFDQGYTKKELAQKYGVSRPTLYKRLGLKKKDD